LDEPEHYGVTCDEERLRTSAALVIRVLTTTSAIHVWACPLKVVQTLMFFGLDPNANLNEGQRKRLKAKIEVRTLSQPSIIGMWGLIREHYGVTDMPSPTSLQCTLLAARTWLDHGRSGSPTRLTQSLAALLYGIHIDQARGMMQRCIQLLDNVDQRVEQSHDRDRTWVGEFLRPIWEGQIRITPALDHALDTLKTTDGVPVESGSLDMTLRIPDDVMKQIHRQLSQASIQSPDQAPSYKSLKGAVTVGSGLALQKDTIRTHATDLFDTLRSMAREHTDDNVKETLIEVTQAMVFSSGLSHRALLDQIVDAVERCRQEVG